MINITRVFRTQTAHRLLAHTGRCKHIHGHEYVWHVTVTAHSLQNGMIVDFDKFEPKSFEQAITDHPKVLLKFKE